MFKRKIKPAGALAEFLGTEASLTPEYFTKKLWEKLYAKGMVRHNNGSVAHRAPIYIRKARAQGKRPILN